METIRYSLDQGIATVTFDEPGSAVNTMKPQWQQDMIALADQLSADAAQLRGVLLTSAKTTFFAGADLNGVLKLRAEDAAAGFSGIELLKKAFRRIECMGKPVVSLINGAALGGGVGLTCACDMAVVADNASFSVSEAKFGILPAVIGPYVVNAVGKRNARYLALTTTRIDANTALSMGMVQRVVSADALDAEVDRVVAELVAGGFAAPALCQRAGGQPQRPVLQRRARAPVRRRLGLALGRCRRTRASERRQRAGRLA